jgi:hypothetical protein
MLVATCVASAQPPVPLATLKAVEASINDRLRSNIAEPYDLLGPARGTYAEGYGAIFSVEVNLTLQPGLAFSPFSAPLKAPELAKLRERKLQKLVALRETMRELVAGAGRALSGMPGNEKVVMEAFLFRYRWEDSHGIPQRILFSAPRQALLDAVERHASATEIAALIEEREL